MCVLTHDPKTRCAWTPRPPAARVQTGEDHRVSNSHGETWRCSAAATGGCQCERVSQVPGCVNSLPPLQRPPIGKTPEWLREEIAAGSTSAGPCPTANPKDLIGVKKVQVGLFPAAGIIEGARAFEDGAAKYGAYNWREYKVRMSVYLDAAQRHLMALRDGEDVAEDSGVSHIGHIISCMALLADATAAGMLIDDRPAKGPAAALLEKHRKKGE